MRKTTYTASLRYVTPWHLFVALLAFTVLQNFRQIHDIFARQKPPTIPNATSFCRAVGHHIGRRKQGLLFRRTFWPDHAKFMAFPGDSRRTGTTCASRVGILSNTAVITFVTELWQDEDHARLHIMARSLRRQSFVPTWWWVLFLQVEGDGRSAKRSLPKTCKELNKYGAVIVQGTGVDLVRAIQEKKHAYSMPKHVLVDEDFSSAFEYNAIEKFVLAQESRRADAVSAWSIVYDAAESSQRFFVRTSGSHRGSYMLRADNPAFWVAIGKTTRAPRGGGVVATLLCDPNLKIVILPEYLIWEDGAARTSHHTGDQACVRWKYVSDDVEVFETTHLRPQRESSKTPGDCGHAASIALVIPWLEYGGADQFNVNLIRNLAKPHNIHTVVITTTSGSLQPLFGEVEAVTEDIFHINYLLPSPDELRSGNPITFVDLVTYLTLTRGADVLLLSNSEPGYLHLEALKLRLPGVQFVDYVHSIALDWINGGYGRYSLQHQRWLDHTLVSSHMLQDWLKDEGHPLTDANGKSIVHLVYVGVDPRECRRLPVRKKRAILQKHGIDPRLQTAIVYPARMSPEKNPARFFDIATRVAQIEPRVAFVAVGGGKLLEDLRTNISREGLDRRIVTLGALAHDATLEVIASSDILMLTSDYEGISLSIFEGMAAGVVPFSTDVGAQDELVTPDTGRLIALDHDVVRKYADELISLASQPAKMRKMKKAARKRVLSEFDTRHLPYKIRDAIC